MLYYDILLNCMGYMCRGFISYKLEIISEKKVFKSCYKEIYRNNTCYE